MAPLAVTLNDLEGHFCCLKPFELTYLGKYSIYYLRYVYTRIAKSVAAWRSGNVVGLDQRG